MGKPTKPNKTGNATANDDVQTRPSTAAFMLDYMKHQMKPGQIILDPARGTGAFYDQFPGDMLPKWCEINPKYLKDYSVESFLDMDNMDKHVNLSKPRNFLECSYPCDWIFTNPPYSIYNLFLERALMLADNVVFLVPLGKVFRGKKINDLVAAHGHGIKTIVDMGGGGHHGFPFGFLVGLLHYQKGHKGPIDYERIDPKLIKNYDPN